MNLNKSLIKVCDECKSDFYKDSSLMESLCPECVHILYGYENCQHEFKDHKHCSKCYWDGSSSQYLDKIKSKK